ncbi:hypothetical protein FCIRC_7389 [Fusarium circinatum]|uniref:Uncharacterized protein n=1 Tax=Fusarium circinatum TaxID=48490 RepID=A0A8H5TTU5_FUSCI|nr:hypothetical protein FCIRC_7389 [Fusarium circinatum]
MPMDNYSPAFIDTPHQQYYGVQLGASMDGCANDAIAWGSTSTPKGLPTGHCGREEDKHKEIRIIQYGEEEPSHQPEKRSIEILNSNVRTEASRSPESCTANHVLSQPPHKIKKYNADGQIQGVEMTMGVSDRKPRRSMDAASRESAARSRKVGACNSCRQGKKRVQATKAPFTLNARHTPSKPLMHQAEWKVYICVKYLRRSLLYMSLDEHGEEHVLEMPPYCLANTEQVRFNLQGYVERMRDKYFHTVQNVSDITCLAVKTALEYANSHPNSMTNMALNMLAYCRVIEKQWMICGDNKLGVTEPTDPKSPWFGFIPVTPAMDVQLDQIMIKHMLDPLRTSLLERLNLTIQSHKPETWFDCFLTIYLLLNHLEEASAHGNRFAKSYGLNRRYSDMKLAQAWFHAAKILLSRFHFISNGSAPFRLDWGDAKKVGFAKLDGREISFIQKTREMMISKDSQFADLKAKNRYERDLYWTHQLFSSKWDAGLPHIEDEVPD